MTSRYSFGGDEHIFVEIDEEMSLEAFFKGLSITNAVRDAGIRGITEICPANASFQIKFNPDLISPDDLMAELKQMGVNYLAPPLWVLVTLENGAIVRSVYATEAKKVGLKLITWTLERSGPLTSGGGWYHQSVKDAITGDGMTYELLHVLAQDVGVEGVFSDWPATVSYYASCMGLD